MQATVHGVAKSRARRGARLSDFTFTFTFLAEVREAFSSSFFPASVLIRMWPESKLNLSTSYFSKTRFMEYWYVPGSHMHYFTLSLQPSSGVEIFLFNCTGIYLWPTMCQDHHLVFLLAQHTYFIFLVRAPQVFGRRLASPPHSPNGSALVFCTPPRSSRSVWPGWPNQHCPALWP